MIKVGGVGSRGEGVGSGGGRGLVQVGVVQVGGLVQVRGGWFRYGGGGGGRGSGRGKG